MSSMKEELLVIWRGINSLYKEKENLMQDIRSHLQKMDNIAKTRVKSLRRDFGAIHRSVVRGIDHTPGRNADVSGTASTSQCTPSGINKWKKSSPPSETDKEKRRLKRRDLRVRVQKTDQTPQGLFTPSSQPATPFPREDSVSGNVATVSEMKWKTQRRWAKPKKKNKSKRKAERIRIRPDAIVVRQKAENGTYAEAFKFMKSKVDGAFAGGKFNKVRETMFGEVLIEHQEGAKVTEVRETIASFLGGGVVVRELQQTVAVDIRDINLDATSVEIANAIRDALPDALLIGCHSHTNGCGVRIEQAKNYFFKHHELSFTDLQNIQDAVIEYSM
ncbi:hypothetical protein QAD02_007694 [Eretmocerus hayati]|uniref:Uncharacterized protein n=1 Tax=Eretmocerus hayati TaxID=131215 RepID=A0ACC2N4E3_9HYME|nr:hypothetical protein QAD02_007694 [Eretmocerus hayati]